MSPGPVANLTPTLSVSSSEMSLNDGYGESSVSSTRSWSPSLKESQDSTDSIVSVDSTSSDSTLTLGSCTSKLNPFIDVPPPLLRKKSGELIKSSLKLPSLVRCKTTSNLPMKKSVSFASRLENVKMFDGTDSPSTVSTQNNSPISSPRNERSSYFVWDWDNPTSKLNNNLNLDDCYSTSEDDDLEEEEEEFSRKSWQLVSSDVRPPVNILRENRPVLLQSIAVSDDKKTLYGFIMCENIAYEKQVNIKLTTNAWKSSIIISNAKYVKSIFPSKYDQFKFSMPLSNYKNLINMELVIQYTVGSFPDKKVFWDNNHGRNYHLTIKSVQPVVSHKNSIPEFEELVQRLVCVQKEIDDDEDEKAFIPRSKSAFGRYNFDNSTTNKTTTTSSSTSTPTKANTTATISFTSQRPPLKTSFSNSDVLSVKPRYSNSYKNRNSSKPPVFSSSPLKSSVVPLKESPTKSTLQNCKDSFNSKSYEDLIKSYCFYQGEQSSNNLEDNSKSSSLGKNLPSYSSTNSLHTMSATSVPVSTASTFQSFSDSIHI